MAYTKSPLLPAMLQAYQQPTFQQNPLLGFQPNMPKASLYGRLFDRLTPQNENSPYALEDEQKKRLFRQGLLQFGVAALQPNGGNTGAAIARGLLAGTTGLNEGARQYTDDAYRAEKMERGLAGEVPAGYQQFEMMAKAAGLTPGTPEYQNAAKIGLGQEGRATNAGYSFSTMKGADGRERIIRRDPRDKNPDTSVMIYDETAGGFVPMGGSMVASAAPAKAAAAGFSLPQQDYGPAETDNYVRKIMGNVGALDPNMPPEQMAQVILPHLIQQESAGNPNAVSPVGAQGLTQVMPATGQDPGFGVTPLRDNSPQENVRFGRDYLTAMLKRYPGRPDLALAAYNAGPGVADRVGRRPASPALSVGRSPEEEAAAVQAAKAAVDLQYAPAMGNVEVQTAGGKARAAAETEMTYAPIMGQIAAQAGAQKVSAEEAAKTRAEFQLSLPKVESDSRQTVALIDKALKHPGRSTATGGSSVYDPRNYLPGTDARDFKVILDQLRGGTFLQAFQSLRGGGAITQVEGTKAEQAIARLDQAQSDEEFVAALKELREIANRAPAQLRQKIRSAQGVQGGRTASPANDDDALINKYLGR